jgi:hypothetical protein
MNLLLRQGTHRSSPVTSSPAVAKGKVVVATAADQVICFG